MEQIENTRKILLKRLDGLDDKSQILKASELRVLYGEIGKQSNENKAAFGQAVNGLKQELQDMVDEHAANAADQERPAIDVTAPFEPNGALPELMTSDKGSTHPLSSELHEITDIFKSMGFAVKSSRQIDDDFHMFTSLNFPEDHPARDDYDTFVTTEGLVAPAHTSTMQHRILKENEVPIRAVVPGRVFRNEDLDARHEHTLHQIEGIVVDEGINVGNLIATMEEFLSRYYQREIKTRTQPAYFPFVEPGFELEISCPFCGGEGCHVCSKAGWIELVGCGMIHPNVLKQAGIDSEKYTGFAWGFGLDRMVMMKHDIEDVRLFHSGNLDFLSNSEYRHEDFIKLGKRIYIC